MLNNLVGSFIRNEYFNGFCTKVYYLSCPGGFIHGVKDLTHGVDIEYMRWMGILQVYFIVFSC
jgi:hypothetical protein